MTDREKKSPKLLVEISKSSDGFKYAYCRQLRIYGSGLDFQQAIKDMLLTAKDLLAEYRADPENLHSSAKLALERLSKHEATILSLLERRNVK